eukprot:5356122-Pyramimonas_sp.AAC.1
MLPTLALGAGVMRRTKERGDVVEDYLRRSEGLSRALLLATLFRWLVGYAARSTKVCRHPRPARLAPASGISPLG